MKIISLLFLCLLLTVPALAANFVNPIGFNPTSENKKAVIEYIKQNVKQECSKVGMDSESTLRMMEEQNLEAFKQLLSAQDNNVLARVINQCCGIGMCNYATIHMMYEQEMKAKKKSLKW
jgi:hypothetical protein